MNNGRVAQEREEHRGNNPKVMGSRALIRPTFGRGEMGLDTVTHLCYNGFVGCERRTHETDRSDLRGVPGRGRLLDLSQARLAHPRRCPRHCREHEARGQGQAQGRSAVQLRGVQQMKPGAALAAMRRIKWHKCAGPGCPASFKGILTARYCSNACRQKAKYRRSKQDAPTD